MLFRGVEKIRTFNRAESRIKNGTGNSITDVSMSTACV